MGTAVKYRLWAVGCALSLLLCVPLVKPWLDMGLIDDPSYARSAQLLAQTGHIFYNGWAAPMLGWHLYWGALFIRLFGFSFNVLRMSTLLEAMAAAFLSHRALVRAGLTEQNATLATLTLVLSPLFLPLTFSYMTDIGGYLVLVLCFYTCLRTLQAETDVHACWWIAFASISNAIGGTIRQTGWLGLLVIIPSTLWLLRRRRRVLLCGIVSLIVGLGMMTGAMEWYGHQPKILPEPVWRGPLTINKSRNIVRNLTRTLFDALLFLLPVLVLFFSKGRWKNPRAWFAALVGAVGIYGILLFIQPQPAVWLEPTIGNYVSEFGALGRTVVHGTRPVILPIDLRLALTIVIIVSVSAMVFALRWSPTLRDRPSQALLPWRSLLVLGGPFSAAYIMLMISRAGANMIFDRYLVPLLFLILLFLLRSYQERISLRTPWYPFVVLAIVAIYSIGVTHDAFSMLRGRLEATRELQARGVPDAEIDGGWEFNSWAALQRTGFLLPHEPSDKDQDQKWDSVAPPCVPLFLSEIPGLDPKYTLSIFPNGCGGQVGIPAVHYREWFGPRDVKIYIVSTDKQVIQPRTGEN